MTTTIDRKQFVNAINIANRVTDPKTSIHATACIMLVATSDTIRIRATDIVSYVHIDIPATTVVDGNAMIVASVLLKTVKAMSDPFITISTNDNGMLIAETNGNKSRELPLYDINTFPAPIDNPGEYVVNCDSSDLRYAIDKTLPFADHDPKTMAADFAGLHLTSRDGRIHVESCDGRRIARTALAAPTSGAIDAIWTIADADTTSALCKQYGGMVLVTHNTYNINIAGPNWVLTGHKVHGKYRDLSAVWPTQSQTTIHIDAKEYASATSYLKKLANKDNQQLAIRLVDDVLTIIDMDNPDGRTTVHVDTISTGLTDRTFSVNAKYLHSITDIIESDYIEMRIDGDESPILFPGERVSYVAMPMKLTLAQRDAVFPPAPISEPENVTPDDDADTHNYVADYRIAASVIDYDTVYGDGDTDCEVYDADSELDDELDTDSELDDELDTDSELDDELDTDSELDDELDADSELDDELDADSELDDELDADSELDDDLDTDSELDDDLDTDSELDDDLDTDSELDDDLDTDSELDDDLDADSELDDELDADSELDDELDTDSELDDDLDTDSELDDDLDTDSELDDDLDTDSELDDDLDTAAYNEWVRSYPQFDYSRTELFNYMPGDLYRQLA